MLRYFPIWGFILALALFELGWQFRKQRKRNRVIVSWVTALFLLLSIGAWFYFAHQNSEYGVREFFEDIGNQF